MYPTIVTAEGLARSAEREIAAHGPVTLSFSSPGSSDHSPRPRFQGEDPAGSLAALARSRPRVVPSEIRTSPDERLSSLSGDVIEETSSRHGHRALAHRARSEGSPSRLASVPGSEASLDALMRRSFTHHASTPERRMGRPSLELHYRLDAHDEPRAQLSDLSAPRAHLRGQIEEARRELSQAWTLVTRSHASDLSSEERHDLISQALVHFHAALATRHLVLAGAEALSNEDQRRARQFAEHPGWRNIGRPVLQAAQEEGLSLGF